MIAMATAAVLERAVEMFSECRHTLSNLQSFPAYTEQVCM